MGYCGGVGVCGRRGVEEEECAGGGVWRRGSVWEEGCGGGGVCGRRGVGEGEEVGQYLSNEEQNSNKEEEWRTSSCQNISH